MEAEIHGHQERLEQKNEEGGKINEEKLFEDITDQELQKADDTISKVESLDHHAETTVTSPEIDPITENMPDDCLDLEVEKVMTSLALTLGPTCAGLLGDLEGKTCANPKAVADEVKFLTSVRKGFRLRPRTPVRQIAKKDRTDGVITTPSIFKEQVQTFTKILSPVCGDDTLARLLMTGYNYPSPMSRQIRVPVLTVEDEPAESDLESEICHECMFCERERVRHHKARDDEHVIMRQLRSPCRCFHECANANDEDVNDQKGKNYIMERFFAVQEDDQKPDDKMEIDPGISNLEIDETDQKNLEIAVKPTEEVIEVIDNTVQDIINIEDDLEFTPKRLLPTVSEHSSEKKRKRGCHADIGLPAKRVSVITTHSIPDRNPMGSLHSVEVTSPVSASYPHSMPNVQRGHFQPHRGHPRGPMYPYNMSNNIFNKQNMTNFTPISGQDPMVKMESAMSMDGYGLNHFPYRPPSSNSSSRSNYSIPRPDNRNWLPIFNAHQPRQMFNPQQSQQVYTQEEVNRMLAPGHPPGIRTAIDRLAVRFTVSRSQPEYQERQVTELLQLACELRREEEIETFYCTWKDCTKHFNRRDSLVRHLRVHVNVRPFRCERCDTRFLRSDHLRVHMLRHTGEQPFACIVCGITFGRKDMRNRHMKTIHYPDERPPKRVLDLLEGENWDDIQIDPEMLRNSTASHK